MKPTTEQQAKYKCAELRAVEMPRRIHLPHRSVELVDDDAQLVAASKRHDRIVSCKSAWLREVRHCGEGNGQNKRRDPILTTLSVPSHVYLYPLLPLYPQTGPRSVDKSIHSINTCIVTHLFALEHLCSSIHPSLLHSSPPLISLPPPTPLLSLTVLCEGNIVLYKGLKVLPVSLHVLYSLLTHPQVSPGVAFQLIPQSSEQAVPEGYTGEESMYNDKERDKHREGRVDTLT